MIDIFQTDLKNALSMCERLAASAVAYACARRLLNSASKRWPEDDKIALAKAVSQSIANTLRGLQHGIDVSLKNELVDAIPTDSTGHSIAHYLLEDSLAAFALCVEALTVANGWMESVNFTSQRAISTIDSYYFERLNTNRPSKKMEELVAEDPLFKQELARQKRDLAIASSPQSDMQRKIQDILEPTQDEAILSIA